MKYLPFIFIFSLMFLTACQESSSKKSSSNKCDGNNYYNYGCPGNPLSTGGTVSGTTGTNPNCIGNAYYTVPGCPGYPGTTTGTSTGGTTGGTTNPFPNYPSQGVTPNWGVQYPGGVPSGNCSSAYAPSGISYTPYETRKATMTIVGGQWYNPASPEASNYMNTSSLLRSVNSARQLFSTDSVLKVRFKVLPQPKSSNSSPYCYGRTTGSSIAGYHKLMFSVTLVGVRANGSTDTEPLGTHTVGVNSCSPAIDLSSYASTYPGGIYLRVEAVQGNQGYYPANYDFYGFRDVDSFVSIRTKDCWTMDVEVAADGTKTFD